VIEMRAAKKTQFDVLARQAIDGFNALISKKSQPKIIVSHEDILGHPTSGGFYCRDHARGAILRTVSKLNPAMVVLVIRPQNELVESYYRQSVMNHKSAPFEDFYNVAATQFYRWDELIKDIWKIIGRKKLKVLPFTAKAVGPELFFRRFCQSLAIELPKTLKKPNLTHRSWNRKKIELARIVNPLITWDEFREFDRFLATSSIGENDASEPFLSEKQKNEILATHLKANKWVFKNVMPNEDMGKLGFLPS